MEKDAILIPDEDSPLLYDKNSSKNIKNSKECDYSLSAVVMIFIFPALGGLLFGYDIGATSDVLVQLESTSYSGIQWSGVVKSNSALKGIITSIG